MIIPRESVLIYQGNNNGEDMCDYSRLVCWIIMNIIVRTERMRGCIIILTESTLISYENNNGEDMW